MKDVRHLWREIAASWALVIAYGWSEARVPMHPGDVAYAARIAFLEYEFWGGLLVVLVPLSWAFLVVRAVQSESLAGDRQFWVTRPYEWKELLATKVLFVLTFVNLPFFILQLLLLANAGFAPAHYLVGLLRIQLMITLVLLLPAATLATVTATVVQLLLALLVLVLYVLGMVYINEQIPSAGFTSPDALLSALAIATPLAVIMLQYARRKTAQARWLIVGLAGTLAVVTVATPYRILVNHEYPPLSKTEEPPFQLVLQGPLNPGTEALASGEKEVEILMPLSVAGVAPDSIPVVNGYLVEIAGPGDLEWNSGWKSWSTSLFPERKSTQIDFVLKKPLFERLKSSSVKVRVSLAVTLFHDTNKRDFVTPQGPFTLTDVGQCFSERRYFQRIRCIAPLRGPSSLLLTSDLSTRTCPLAEGETRANPGEIARGWTQNDGSPEIGIDPVKNIDLYLSDWDTSSKRRPTGICPGTPLVLSDPQPVERSQFTLQFDGVRLSDYHPKPLADDGSDSSGLFLRLR